MRAKRLITVLAVTFMIVSSLGIGSGAQLSPSEQGQSVQRVPHGQPANFTYTISGHQPGSQVAWTALATGGDQTPNFQYVNVFSGTWPQGIQWDCQLTQNARAAGIDRNNDDPGTTTDESILGSYRSKYTRRNDQDQFILTVEFAGQGDFGGTTFSHNHSDQFVAGFSKCLTLPSQPGWYRVGGYINGTNYNGNFAEMAMNSNWLYVCDCASRDEAVQQLGEPPSESGGLLQTDGNEGRPNWDLTGSSSSNSGSTTPQSTATPQSTPTDSSGQQTTTGPSAPQTTSGSTGQTATPAQQTNAGPSTVTTTGSSATQQSTAQRTAAQTTSVSTGQSASTVQQTVTTTGTSQPGFGSVIAVISMLAAVVLFFRRS